MRARAQAAARRRLPWAWANARLGSDDVNAVDTAQTVDTPEQNGSSSLVLDVPGAATLCAPVPVAAQPGASLAVANDFAVLAGALPLSAAVTPVDSVALAERVSSALRAR